MYRAIPALWFYALILLSILALVRFILSLPWGLIEDEAYYWTWAQIPSPAYFDHTGGIGLLGWMWQKIAGLNFLGFRVLNGVLSLVTGMASLAACYTLLPPENRAWQPGVKNLTFGPGLILLFLAFTTVQATHLAWVPDALYLPCLSLAIWQICRILGPFGAEKPHHVPHRAWAWAGLFLGLGMLAKEIVLFYALLFCLFALIHHDLRRQLQHSIWPWIGLLLMIAAGLPILVWNVQNDWILLKFQTTHALISNERVFIPHTFMDQDQAGVNPAPVAAQNGGGGPNRTLDTANLLLAYGLLLGPALIAARRHILRTWQQHWPLWALFIGPSLMYFSISLAKGLQTQWALPSIHIGILLCLPLAAQGTRRQRWWMIGLALFFSILVYLLLTVRTLALAGGNTQSPFIWPDLFKKIEAYQQALEQEYGEPVLILANRYQDASELNYYRTQSNDFQSVAYGPAENRTLLPALNINYRSNHYDLIWPDLKLGGYLAIFIDTHNVYPPGQAFAEILDRGNWETPVDKTAYLFGRLADQPRQQLVKTSQSETE